jgi:hypothetical protein
MSESKAAATKTDSDVASLQASDKKGAPVNILPLTEDIFTDDALDPIYQHKARVLNDALQAIGQGKYQVSSANFLHLA